MAASSLVVAACGSSGGNGSGPEDSKSAQQIIKDAQAALKSATSYHIKGSVKQNDTTIGIDVKVQDKETASGHLDEGGLGFDFVLSGGKVYIHGSDFVAKVAGQNVAAAIGDKWIAASMDDPRFSSQLGGVTAFTDPSGLADSLGSETGTLSKDGTTTVNGKTAVVIKASDGTLDVADANPAYPLRLNGGSLGTLDITDYGADFGISVPSNVLDLSTISGGSTDTSTGTGTDTGSGTDTTTDTSTDTTSS